MFSYTICTEPDESIYLCQCAALEKNIPGLEKTEELRDVDNSSTSIYRKDGIELKVSNSYYIGCVYIDSEFDIEPYFQK